MNVCRPARIALLSLAAFLIQIDGLMASAANVSQGACLYGLDHSADRAFEISNAQSMHIDCGSVVKSGGRAVRAAGIQTNSLPFDSKPDAPVHSIANCRSDHYQAGM
jgi:hypothetical protein